MAFLGVIPLSKIKPKPEVKPLSVAAQWLSGEINGFIQSKDGEPAWLKDIVVKPSYIFASHVCLFQVVRPDGERYAKEITLGWEDARARFDANFTSRSWQKTVDEVYDYFLGGDSPGISTKKV